MNDIFDNGTPKYSTAIDIYDALQELVQTEEMGILGEMFTDVSWDGQDYYYTDAGYKLKEQFDELTNFGNDMWIMDLAILQTQEWPDIHDTVWEALHNDDLAKRTGFKKLFIDIMLRGDKLIYNEVTEEWAAELGELDRFDFHSLARTFQAVMNKMERYMPDNPYSNFCNAYRDKIMGLRLEKEKILIEKSRALLTAYDDFMFGLKANQNLYTELEQRYRSKQMYLQECYDAKVKQLMMFAELQGVALELPGDVMLLAEGDDHG